MTANAVFYKDDTGETILATIDYNISAATELKIYVKRPDGLEKIWPVTGNATIAQANPGILSYATIAGDLDLPGTYHFHARVIISTKVHTGPYAAFLVATKYSPVTEEQKLSVVID